MTIKKTKQKKLQKSIKLNLGCGFKHKPGFTNVDAFPLCNPDVLLDLESFPWPFEDNSVDEIQMHHVLEHLGQDVKVYFKIFQEIYRICQPNAKIEIVAPHWMHQNFAHDPTHCRIVTPIGLAMFSKQRNLNDMANGGAESKLGIMNNVDFEVENVMYAPDQYWAGVSVQENWDEEKIHRMISEVPGVCVEIQITLRVIK